MDLDHASCYRAVTGRDRRFDGWFFSAVTSTGIYCRPSCPAMTPKPSNVAFFASAAAAQQAGFRACRRCRPDLVPGSPEWDRRGDVVARAMRLIADGIVEREGVVGLAKQLGYSVRQVERLLVAEVGAGPVALARAQRAQSARLLIETTVMAMTTVAFAAGFASVRQFNDTLRSVFGLTPSELRARSGSGRTPAPRQLDSVPQTIALRLPYRAPLPTGALLRQLEETGVRGIEEVVDGTYRRTLRLNHQPATVALREAPGHLACRLTLGDVRDLTSAIARCRRLLDLDADPLAIDEVLAGDEALRPAVATTPGRRVGRSVDEEEMAVRTVLGRRLSDPPTRARARLLVLHHGSELQAAGGSLTHLFPTPAQLAGDPQALGVIGHRARTCAALVSALAEGRVRLGPGVDRHEARARLREVPGLSARTVELIAMRAVGDPDAFPALDAHGLRGAAALGLPTSRAALSARAERWRPWRAYAAETLWSVSEHPMRQTPVPKGFESKEHP